MSNPLAPLVGGKKTLGSEHLGVLAILSHVIHELVVAVGKGDT